MDRPRLERLAEAYEVLYDECRLEVFSHRNPAAIFLPEEIEDESSASDESESATESDQSSTSSSDEDSTSPSGRSSTAIQEEIDEAGPDGWLTSWTEIELALLFPSLARRSRWFPDLIAQDLGFSKSPSQVDHLLSKLKEQSDLDKKSLVRQQQDGNAASRADRRSRRIGRIPGAYEVSEEWLNLEETLAARLQKWQDIEDHEGNVEMQVSQPNQTEAEEGEQGPSKEEEEEEEEMRDGSIIGWDTQVINALLFLRHCSECNSNSNAANFVYNVPLSAWSGESELELFSFSASLAVDLLANKRATTGKAVSAYKGYSRNHPTPKTHLLLEGKSKTLAWRILLRGVELGILAWVYLGGADGGSLLEGTLPDNINKRLKSTQAKKATFKRAQRHQLVWLDTLTGDSRSPNAIALLQDAKDSAIRRLIASLEWEEALAINRSLNCVSLGSTIAEEPSEGSQQPSTPQFEVGNGNGKQGTPFGDIDLSAYTYAERNKIRARFRARVARYGREAALAMPIEAQKTGRKRKGEELDGNTATKRIRRTSEQRRADRGEDEGDADDEAGLEEEEEEKLTTSETPEQLYLPSARLPRFEQVGVSLETVLSLLPKTTKDTLELFSAKPLKHIAQFVEKQKGDKDGFHIGGASPDSLTLLSTLLREYLTRLLSSVLDVVSSGLTGKGEPRKLISASDVKAALLLSQSEHSLSQEGEGLEVSAALNLFRSDPPRFYHCDANKRQELEIQLHGLKTLRSASQFNQRHNSTIADTVISASDTFHIPTLSTYAPHIHATATDEPVMDFSSSSEESSVYDDSDQEMEILNRRDASRGVPREANYIDGRRWDYNERREVKDNKRWERLDERDEVKAARYEGRLWKRIGLKARATRRLLDSGAASLRVSVDQSESSSEEEEEDSRVEYDAVA